MKGVLCQTPRNPNGFDLIDKFNDTSRYLYDTFTIDNPAFAEHIPDIYPRELQLNKANTSDKQHISYSLCRVEPVMRFPARGLT